MMYLLLGMDCIESNVKINNTNHTSQSLINHFPIIFIMMPLTCNQRHQKIEAFPIQGLLMCVLNMLNFLCLKCWATPRKYKCQQ